MLSNQSHNDLVLIIVVQQVHKECSLYELVARRITENIMDISKFDRCYSILTLH